ncbi:MAG: anion permease [Phycisphaerales bacterium]|nr:anion permease [Phycisphaerales bacterium]
MTTLIVFLTEITSNTATTSTMLPVLAAAGEGMGIDPTLLVIAAAVSASCAFMLPVATPPNAIVFASGRITIKQMALAGFGLNLICIVIITLMVWGLAPKLLNLDKNTTHPIDTQSSSMIDRQDHTIAYDSANAPEDNISIHSDRSRSFQRNAFDHQDHEAHGGFHTL